MKVLIYIYIYICDITLRMILTFTPNGGVPILAENR
jgi:hypothetical protein